MCLKCTSNKVKFCQTNNDWIVLFLPQSVGSNSVSFSQTLWAEHNNNNNNINKHIKWITGSKLQGGPGPNHGPHPVLIKNTQIKNKLLTWIQKFSLQIIWTRVKIKKPQRTITEPQTSLSTAGGPIQVLTVCVEPGSGSVSAGVTVDDMMQTCWLQMMMWIVCLSSLCGGSIVSESQFESLTSPESFSNLGQILQNQYSWPQAVV